MFSTWGPIPDAPKGIFLFYRTSYSKGLNHALEKVPNTTKHTVSEEQVKKKRKRSEEEEVKKKFRKQAQKKCRRSAEGSEEEVKNTRDIHMGVPSQILQTFHGAFPQTR